MEKNIQKDITYDGKPEKVVYKVWGESWESPDFSLEISDGDAIIYQEKSTISYWDNAAHFNAWHECEDIAKCKEERYCADHIFSWWFEDIKPSEDRYDFMMENFANSAPDGIASVSPFHKESRKFFFPSFKPKPSCQFIGIGLFMDVFVLFCQFNREVILIAGFHVSVKHSAPLGLYEVVFVQMVHRGMLRPHFHPLLVVRHLLENSFLFGS